MQTINVEVSNFILTIVAVLMILDIVLAIVKIILERRLKKEKDERAKKMEELKKRDLPYKIEVHKHPVPGMPPVVNLTLTKIAIVNINSSAPGAEMVRQDTITNQPPGAGPVPEKDWKGLQDELKQMSEDLKNKEKGKGEE